METTEILDTPKLSGYITEHKPDGRLSIYIPAHSGGSRGEIRPWPPWKLAMEFGPPRGQQE